MEPLGSETKGPLSPRCRHGSIQIDIDQGSGEEAQDIIITGQPTIPCPSVPARAHATLPCAA
jgi:hypothetical protein